MIKIKIGLKFTKKKREITKDPNDLNLIVEVLDEDLLTNDENIGKVVLPVGSFTNQQVVEKWFPLSTPDKEHVSGDVRLQITRRDNELKVKCTLFLDIFI